MLWLLALGCLDADFVGEESALVVGMVWLVVVLFVLVELVLALFESIGT